MATASTLLPADIAADLLDFSDAEFAAAPTLDVHAREVRLLDSGFVGIAIAAQSQIHVDAQAVLPIAIAVRCDGERDWDLPLGDNCLLVATEMQSGRVSVVPALVPPKVLASRHQAQATRAGPVRPPADELAGYGAQIAWTEVRCRIDLPWRSSAWSFGLVHFDWVSNLVSVALEGGEATRPDAAAPLSVNPQPAAGAPGLPSYLPGSRTPPMPSTPGQGVNFNIELDERGPAARLIVDAAFSTPARPHALVAGLTLPDGGQEQEVAAIVPVTLLLVGANAVHPWRRDLAVPVYGAPVQAGEPIEGCLSWDAFSDAPAPGPGEFACYLVLDGAIHGPQRIRVTR